MDDRTKCTWPSRLCSDVPAGEMLFAMVPLRMLGKGPTEMPEFGPSGHNTSTFAYPETEHGRDVYYNAYGDLDDGESNSTTSRPVSLALSRRSST